MFKRVPSARTKADKDLLLIAHSSSPTFRFALYNLLLKGYYYYYLFFFATFFFCEFTL